VGVRDREKVRAYRRKYRAKNRVKLRDLDRKYRAANLEKVRALSRERKRKYRANRAIGLLGDNEAGLRRALAYLTKEHK